MDDYDPVDHPLHYNQGGIEAIEYIEDSLGDGYSYYLEGSMKKYIHRWRYKAGLEDLQKAEWYLVRLIENEQMKDIGKAPE